MKPCYEHIPILQGLVGSIIRLIDWHPVHAGVKDLLSTNKPVRLNILPLHELIDMFHSHSASDRRDKVYALLGMSSHSFDTTILNADYNKPWSTLFRDLIQTIFGPQLDLTISDAMELAFIRVKGYPLGRITSIESNVDSSGRQRIQLESIYHHPDGIRWNACWAIESTSKSIKKGDLLCLLQGAQNPTIVRLTRDHTSIISIATRPPKELQVVKNGIYVNHGSGEGLEITKEIEWSDFSQHITTFPCEFHLAWNWELTNEDGEIRIQSPETPRALPSKLKSTLDDTESELERVLNMALILVHMRDRDAIGKVLEDVTQLEESRNIPLRLSSMIRTLRIVHQQWESYLLLRLTLQDWIRPEKEVQFLNRSIASYLQSQTQELDLVGVLSILESSREEIGRFAIAMIERRQFPCSWPISFDDSEAVHLIFQLLGGITVSQEDLLFTARHKMGGPLMEILICYRPDDAQMLESTIKAAAENAHSGAEIIKVILQHCQDEVSISEGILTKAAKNILPECFGTLLDWPWLNKPQITLATVKEIARNRHCGPELLTLAFDDEPQNLPLSQEVLEILKQNREKGLQMLSTLFANSRDWDFASHILEVSAACHENNPASGRSWTMLLRYYNVAKSSGHFNGKSYTEMLRIVYRNFHYNVPHSDHEYASPLSALRSDVEEHCALTIGNLVLRRIESLSVTQPRRVIYNPSRPLL